MTKLIFFSHYFYTKKKKDTILSYLIK